MTIGKSMFAALLALSAGLGMSVSTATQAAGNACVKQCQRDYTDCWYSCTPGNTGCYDMCRLNYESCAADCG